MQRTLISQTLACALVLGLTLKPIKAHADDIDIFTGASAGSAINPRILIVLDNTSNWARQSQQWPGGISQGQSEVNAIKTVVADLDSTVNLGVMEFVTDGSSTDDGGFIRFAVKPMNATNKTTLSSHMTTIYNDINSPQEKRNSHTPYGNLMYDVYNYFAGANSYSPSATNAARADSDGYTTNYTQFRTPLTADNTCGKSYLIFIGNPNSSGPAADTAANTARLAALGGVTTQLPLPNYTQATVSTATQVGVTAACYADATAAEAGLGAFSASCSSYTQGCSIGSATANTAPIACAAGTQAYSVVRKVHTPASSSASAGTPVVGTSTTNTGTTTGYYAASSAVDPNSDHGALTCPSTTTTTSTDADGVTNTATTTYSCSYAVGSAVGSVSTTTTSSTSTSCYSGVGTGTGQWDANTTTDFGDLACPSNHSCTYSGVSLTSSLGCGSSGRKVTVTQSATNKRQYTITQTVTPTTTNSTGASTPASDSYTTLGFTSQCYASGPASTTDYAASCTGTNISCTYNNAPTSSTLAVCPAGTSAYSVLGTNVEYTNVATSGSTTDSATYNADEWARFLHDKGIPVTGTTIRPAVTTYTIDVYNKQPNATHTSLLLSMAKAGGGKYFSATNENAIVSALKQIMSEILAVNSAFASTSLPVNATNRSQNENQVFIGMFRPDPDSKPRWFGNLKRYQLISSGASIELGDINGNLAVNTSTGFLTPCAISYWTSASGTYWSGLGINPDPAGTCATATAYSDSPDGPNVEKGAVAQVLRNGNNPTATTTTPTYAVNRTIYSRSGSAFNTFNATNTGLAADVVAFIRGEDTNNEKGTGSLTTTRPSIHGDVIHSRPLPINYGSTTGIVVYYGANDGMFRAVQASTGKELWAFVAPEFNDRLSRLKTQTPYVTYPGGTIPGSTKKDYFFDGSTGVYQNEDSSRVWVFPTMRRGGRMVYGIDATAPTAPVMKWAVGCPNLSNDTGCTSGLEGIGQTWSTPVAAKIKGYSTSEPVLIFGGGYDNCEDTDSAAPSCGATKGGFVYVLRATDGALLKTFTTARAVVGDVALADIDNDSMPDYAYAADTGGNIYRLDFIDAPSTKVGLAPASWRSTLVGYTNTFGRKFLFAPALLATTTGGHYKTYVAIGSGDREHPLASQYPYTGVSNRFYVLLDDLTQHDAALAADMDTVLTDVTATNSCAAAQALPGNGSRGWFLRLASGEQVVTSALIASGMVTFSTNKPLPASTSSCAAPLGVAYGYWVNLFNGSGAIGVNGTCGGERNSVFVGGGLPPSPVMASAVPVDNRATSVVIGAIQKTGGASVAISPQKIRPTISSRRQRSYTYTR
jgi:Tfp pilus tip-associated adhesin PilY1